MKIKNRLTVEFSILVGSILIIFSVIVYYLTILNQRQEFYQRLETNAVNTTRLLTEISGMDSTQLNIIENTLVYFFSQRKVMIFGPDDKVLFTTPSAAITPKTIGMILPQIRKGKTIYRMVNKKSAVGFIYRHNNEDLRVIATAVDELGRRNIRDLGIVLLTGDLLTILITLIAGFYFSHQALKPMSEVVKQVNSINGSQLNTRVKIGPEKDEISSLADTFNSMLDRLQEAFELQRSFVSNASHSIRTPLTSINGQIEIALLKQRTKEEYENILNGIHGDIRNLTSLTNSLLYLAHTGDDIGKLLSQKVRLDEALLLAQTEIEKLNKNYIIVTDFDQLPEEENKLTINSNENLLKIIFFNLIDNACRYSDDHRVNITISFSEKYTIIKFTDHGRGLSTFDQKKIFEPFYRGSSSKDIKGHGLGLSLVKKILDFHKARITIDSQPGTGTIVSLYFTTT